MYVYTPGSLSMLYVNFRTIANSSSKAISQNWSLFSQCFNVCLSATTRNEHYSTFLCPRNTLDSFWNIRSILDDGGAGLNAHFLLIYYAAGKEIGEKLEIVPNTVIEQRE